MGSPPEAFSQTSIKEMEVKNQNVKERKNVFVTMNESVFMAKHIRGG